MISLYLSTLRLLITSASAACLFAEITTPNFFYELPADEFTDFYNEVTVTESVDGTYFATTGFESGYAGIQQGGNLGAKQIQFSIWDPGQPSDDASNTVSANQVELLWAPPSSVVGRFGGEGIGLSTAMLFDWQVGVTYAFLIRAERVDTNHIYRGYFYDTPNDRWIHLATLRTRFDARSFNEFYSFVEDFRRDSVAETQTRRALYGNTWARDIDGTWHELTSGTVSPGSVIQPPTPNYLAAAAGNRIELANGAGISSVGIGDDLITRSSSGMSAPTLPAEIAPQITAQPTNISVPQGDVATFSVAAQGESPHYQWLADGVPLAGQNRSQLSLFNVSQLDGLKSYSVRVSNVFGSVDSDAVQLTIETPAITAESPPAITVQPVDQIISAGGQATFSITANGNDLAYRWFLNGAEILAENESELTLINVDRGRNGGYYHCEVSNSVGTVRSVAAALTVGDNPLRITSHPISTIATEGERITFSVTAIGSGSHTYQWFKDDQFIAGATNSTYEIASANAGNMGSYVVVVTNEVSAVTSQSATLIVNPIEVTPMGFSRLSNLSIRSRAGAGDKVLIVGFVIGGSGSKQVLLRGIGPTLEQYGVTDFVTEPQLKLFDANSLPITDNRVWGGGSTLAATFNQVGAFPLAFDSKDSALLLSLSPALYSAQIAAGANSGIALVEAYDVDARTSPAQLKNLSARTEVGTGADALIVGFAIDGDRPLKLLIRATGPTLSGFGVSGVLDNPVLTVRSLNPNTVVANNDDWSGNPTLQSAFNTVGAFGWSDAASQDAAVIVELPPGLYTATATGLNDTTGVALVELYLLP